MSSAIKLIFLTLLCAWFNAPLQSMQVHPTPQRAVSINSFVYQDPITVLSDLTEKTRKEIAQGYLEELARTKRFNKKDANPKKDFLKYLEMNLKGKKSYKATFIARYSKVNSMMDPDISASISALREQGVRDLNQFITIVDPEDEWNRIVKEATAPASCCVIL